MVDEIREVSFRVRRLALRCPFTIQEMSVLTLNRDIFQRLLIIKLHTVRLDRDLTVRLQTFDQALNVIYMYLLEEIGIWSDVHRLPKTVAWVI